MMVSFRDACGQSYNISLPENATVADACKLLSEKTGINDNQIFLISNTGDMNFYQDTQSMSNVLKENHDYVVFMKNLFGENDKQNISQPEFNKTDDNTEQLNLINKISEQSLIVPPNSFYNRVQSVKDWQYSDTYDDYSRVLNSIPYDFEERVNKIAEYGFAIHDIKEALRTTDYDVLVATHLLVLVNSHRLDDIDDDASYSDYDYIDEENEIEYYNRADSGNEITNKNETKEEKQITNNEEEANKTVFQNEKDNVNNQQKECEKFDAEKKKQNDNSTSEVVDFESI